MRDMQTNQTSYLSAAEMARRVKRIERAVNRELNPPRYDRRAIACLIIGYGLTLAFAAIGYYLHYFIHH